jgi:hypothetical protein
MDATMSVIGQKHSQLAVDYFVITKRDGRPPTWEWQILRMSKPLGIRLNGGNFKWECSAKLAGEKALKELLDRLAQEENNC